MQIRSMVAMKKIPDFTYTHGRIRRNSIFGLLGKKRRLCRCWCLRPSRCRIVDGVRVPGRYRSWGRKAVQAPAHCKCSHNRCNSISCYPDRCCRFQACIPPRRCRQFQIPLWDKRRTWSRGHQLSEQLRVRCRAGERSKDGACREAWVRTPFSR